VRALLEQIKTPLSSFSADSAYDRARVYGASPDTVGIAGFSSRRGGMRAWTSASERRSDSESGITKRSTVENVFHRYKSVLGREMKARTLAGQRVEARLGYYILNKMARLGMPETQRVP
jgi:hypothetical protein